MWLSRDSSLAHCTALKMKGAYNTYSSLIDVLFKLVLLTFTMVTVNKHFPVSQVITRVS